MIRQIFQASKPPHGLIVDLVKFPGFYTLRFYKSQWDSFSEGQRVKCLEYLSQVKDIMEDSGYKVALEPIDDIRKKT